jgi:signal transduction histidine kinase
MKPWQSVSTRLTFTLLAVTLGNVAGLFVIIDQALMQFFVRDAQATLSRQAHVLADKSRTRWQNLKLIRELTEITSQQAKVEVIIFDRATKILLENSSVQSNSSVKLPSDIIPKTLTGVSQSGRLYVAKNPHFQWWLYSAAPIKNIKENQIIGVVYVAMPLKRPRRFADEVKGLVMVMAMLSAGVAAIAGLILSRTLTNPLRILRHQAIQLETGNYNIRSHLKGNDELARLGHILDQMAEKLMQTLTALQAQEKARRELVANVSHDLRTPLASLRLGLEAVIDGVVTENKAQEYIQRACRETDYLSYLVEQLLLLAQADAGQLAVHPQSVCAVAIAQECIYRMQPTAMQVGLELILSVTSKITTVWVDPELTGQVIINLIDNAIKYAPESQNVGLHILPPIEKQECQYIPLEVQDFGKGMTEDVIQRLTERFYRVNNARPRGGLGLGLAIAEQICQLQGSFLEIKSELEKGTIITLYLPIRE